MDKNVDYANNKCTHDKIRGQSIAINELNFHER